MKDIKRKAIATALLLSVLSVAAYAISENIVIL
ncbi:hypothetical protein MNBD_GAMMA01-2030 [hydrothermal vent metagenome]|uniref:Uncharacterized protein n=1 Tax=hydrothermal vent metagenome TaxID=652676 RepID=A0A3B0V753_9ZZZZ